MSNWIEKFFWNCVELIEYIGQITNLGYELTNIMIFFIIQPSLILIFLMLWVLEKRKNKKLSSFKNENSPSPYKEFLWRISRVLSFLVFLIELIIIYSIFNSELFQISQNQYFRKEIIYAIIIFSPIVILIIFNFLSFGRASIWIKKR